MTLVQGGLDSPLITEENSSGIIQEAMPQSEELPEIQLEATSQPETSYMSRAELNPLQQEADAYTKEFDFVEKTSLTDSMVASAKSWDFLGLYDMYKLENTITDNEAGLYTPDPDFTIQHALDRVDIPLTKEEVEWLNRKDITSDKAFDLYIDNIKEKRELQRVASVNPKVSMLTSFLDPTYIATGGAIAKGASMLKLGKFATSAIVGASEYSVTTAQEYHRPVSTLELVASTAIPTAITMAVYKRPIARQSLNGSSEASDIIEVGKAKIATPEYDSVSNAGTVKFNAKETLDSIDNIDAINASRNMPLGKKPELVMPETKLDAQGLEIPFKVNRNGLPHSSEINWKQTNSKGMPIELTAYRYLYNAVEDTRIPQSIRDMSKRLLLQGGKDLTEMPVEQVAKLKQAGRYYPSKNKIKIRKGTSASTLNHEVVHGLTSIKIHYGKQNPNSVHGELVRELEELREFVKANYDQRRKANPKEFSIRQQQEISYALKDPEEFLAGLYEGDTAFKKLLESIETPNNLKKGSEKNLLQSLYTGLRRLLGFTVEEANAFNKAMKLSDDLIDSPKIQYTDVNGKLHEFKASEVTPELIERVSAEEADNVFKANLTQRVGRWMSWNLYDTLAHISPEWVKPILSNPTQGAMQGNVVSTKRYLASRFGLSRVDAEQAIERELSNRGVGVVDRFIASEKYRNALNDIQLEVAEYVERRSQAKGKALPDEDTAVARIAKHYNNMTQEAKAVGVRAGIFGEAVGDVNWYLPRKIDSTKFMNVYNRFKEVYGAEHATTKFVDALATTMNLGGDAKYTRHIAYIYYKRMHDKYNHSTDAFRGHMGNELVGDVKGYLSEIGVNDPFTVEHIEKLLTGALDKRGEASFQKMRLDINTLQDVYLPDGSSFRFFDMMDTNVIDLYSRYGDNVAGRVALAEQGLGTPTLWNKYREEFMQSPKLKDSPELRERYGKLLDDIYADVLGYPVGEQLHPFLQATRAFTQSVALKFSGIWQVMEIVPTMIRHARANGISETFSVVGKSYFQSLKTLERAEANELSTFLMRSAMDDLKISPMSARQADNFDLNTNTLSAKINHMNQYTYVVNAMRFLMGKQSIASANLIVHNVKRAVKGEEKSIRLLKKYGMNDSDLKIIKEQLDKHGTDYRSWELDAQNGLLPKLVNLMDTDVLRSRLGEIPAFMQFSSVGKVLGTFRNFIFSSHNKIFTSNLRDEGVLAVALITAYQLPMAMLSVQVATLAKGDDLIDDPAELLRKAIAQLGGLGLLPEVWGIVNGETRGVGSPFTLGIDRVIGVGNALGSGDPLKVAEATGSAIPILSVTLGFQAGLNAVLDTMREDESN